MENVTYIDHPLVQHKISMLRKKTTGTNEFRTLVEEIATLMGYEALRDLPLEDVEVETPIETCMTPMLAGKKLSDRSDPARRSWNGKRCPFPRSFRKDRSYRSLPRRGDS